MREFKQLTPFYVFNRLLTEYSNTVFRGILRTPPIETDPSSDCVLFSILQKKDVRPYLLAAKSFLRFCPPLNVVIQSDGSLDDDSCREIRAHIRHASFLSRESSEELVRSQASKPLLRLLGETNWWVELKLLNPLFRFAGRYVILFDSDLLFLRRPNAVIECLTANPPRTFHSPGGNQLAAAFHKIGFDFGRVDVRSFNAGFIGFLNDFPREALVPIADAIRSYDPNLFKVWDIEQALWSVLLNGSNDPLNLKSVDTDYVGNGWSRFEMLHDKAVMAHFVGATRFRRLMYVRLAQKVVRELMEGTGPSGAKRIKGDATSRGGASVFVDRLLGKGHNG